MRGSYCHCQHVMTFFFWSSTYSLGEVVIQNGNLLAPGAPLFALGPLISLGGPGDNYDVLGVVGNDAPFYRGKRVGSTKLNYISYWY